MAETMRAVRVHSRDGPKAIAIEQVPVPRLGPGDALVRVHAAAITPTEFTWNSMYTTREGKDRLPSIPSFEVSGTVEAIAPDVGGPSKGDEVYGLLDFWRDGAAAEFVAVRAADLAPKPESIDHAHAASVPLSGLTAWQALFDYGQLAARNRVLIQGAAGGVGTYAVQLAHERGAKVFGTASARNADFLRSLGADEVLDYHTPGFEEGLRDMDVVVDTVGGDTLEHSWPTVRRGGMLVTIVGDAPSDRAAREGIRAASILVQPNRPQLIELGKRIDAGTLRPIVEATYPLARAREAYERGLLGHNRGKLVLQVRA
jgi:NADPH:quinone reductase-like Zn-dependent oxidoreductase